MYLLYQICNYNNMLSMKGKFINIVNIKNMVDGVLI